MRSECCCCRAVFAPRGTNDPWGGRLDAFCEDCALTRCDAFPGACRDGHGTPEALAPTLDAPFFGAGGGPGVVLPSEATCGDVAWISPAAPLPGSFVCHLPAGHEGRHESMHGPGARWDGETVETGWAADGGTMTEPQLLPSEATERDVTELRMEATVAVMGRLKGIDPEWDPADQHEDIREALIPVFDKIAARLAAVSSPVQATDRERIMTWSPLDDPKVRDEMRERLGRETAEQVIVALVEVEPPLSPEAVLENWKFACAGWHEQADAYRNALEAERDRLHSWLHGGDGDPVTLASVLESLCAALAAVSVPPEAAECEDVSDLAESAQWALLEMRDRFSLERGQSVSLDALEDALRKSEGAGEEAGTETRPSQEGFGLHQPHPVQEKPGTGLPLSACHFGGDVLCEKPCAQHGECVHPDRARTSSAVPPEAARCKCGRLPTPEGMQRITHGRHCLCSACAREDWTNPKLAPCGMHGAECPRSYQPLGGAGDLVPAAFLPEAAEPEEAQ